MAVTSTKPTGQKIISVDEGSAAHRAGAKAGDILLSINGNAVRDALDIIYYGCDEQIGLKLLRGSKSLTLSFFKGEDEPLGIALEELTVTRCKNNCIFCFINQLPKSGALRDSLRFKDDDWRFSVISGNYVTLTNLAPGEIDRIIKQRFSPLYVSVHCTDERVRRQMLGNPKSPDIMPLIKRLSESGILLHAQAVICGGVNDGELLTATIRDLSRYCESLAVVPVGLTRFSTSGLKPLSERQARDAVAIVDAQRLRCLRERETPFVYAADEMYVLAGLEVPPERYYGNYCQIENGVGLVRKFLEEFFTELKEHRGKKPHKGAAATLVTGEAFFPYLKEAAAAFDSRFKTETRVVRVENAYFGNTVTVAGLLTGGDILKKLSGLNLGGGVIIPRTMLKEFEDVFLDGMELKTLAERLNTRITVTDCTGAGLIESLIFAAAKGREA